MREFSTDQARERPNGYYYTTRWVGAQVFSFAGSEMAAAGFGQRVFQARLALSAARGKTVTQADIAREMGVVGVTVGRWEAGLKEPDLATIERLAVVLKTSAAWLAFGQEGGEQGGEQSPATPPTPVPTSPPQRPFKEVSRHAKAPLHPIKPQDQGKGRKKA